MLRKTVIPLVLPIVLILWATPMIFGATFKAEKIPDKRLAPTAPAMSQEKIYCVILNDDGSATYYHPEFNAGDGVAAYMDPLTCGHPITYPFKVTDAHFYLHDWDGAVWPVEIQVNVREREGSTSCNGPGNLLCSKTFTLPAESAFPNMIELDLDSLCCVDQPFFLEIVYTGGTSPPYPSLLFSDETTNPADTCYNWLLAGGTYYEWYDAWTPPVPGNAIIRAGGNTQSLDCLPGWYWKPPYEDYAPSGMPDIDQKQDNWIKPVEPIPQWTFCGPCAVANCFKWFDSKYNVPPGFPFDGADVFPLVRDYMDALAFSPWNTTWLWDDHDPWNVDHPATPWGPPIGDPPPATPQPFVPGPQPQPSGMPYWGELVERLAWYFNTDAIQTGYCDHAGTNIIDMQEGIDAWFESETFEDGSTLTDTLCEVTTAKPTFAYVESLVEKCEDVILLLGFWFEDPPGSGSWYRIGGHYVTVAGVNSDSLLIAFSDPWIDAAELGIIPGVVKDGSIIPHDHPHDSTVHNDEGNVSQDIYAVAMPSPSPGGVWWLPDYPIWFDPYLWTYNFYAQSVPDEFLIDTAPWNETSPIYTEVEYCVHISPWDYVGDANGSGATDMADAVYIVNWLFLGGPAPVSMIEGDANCSRSVDMADAVFIVNWLFAGGPIPRCCDP